MAPREQAVPLAARVAVSLTVLIAGVAAAHAAGARPVLRFEFPPNPLERLEKTTAVEVAVPATPSPPELDGRLDDAVWRDAATFAVGAAGAMPRVDVRVCYDKDNLYFGVRRAATPGRPVQAAKAPRDGKAVYGGDCVEMWFLTPFERSLRTYQFVVNAAGSVYESRNGDSRYDPAWRCRTSLAGNAWTAEIAIPKEALGLTTWDRRIAFNLGHNAPNMAPRPWVGRYGGLNDAALVLEGVRSVVRAAAAAPPASLAAPEGAGLKTTGDGLNASTPIGHARPGDRYVEVLLRIDRRRVPLEGCALEAVLARPSDGKVVARAAVSPPRPEGRLLVDLRTAGLTAASLHLRLTSRGKSVASAVGVVTARAPEGPLVAGERIPVLLDPPSGGGRLKRWPVTFGVPFGAGRVWDAGRLRLVDDRGAEVPHQREVTGRWAPDGAAQWVRFDALVDSSRRCFVEVGAPGAGALPGPRVNLTEKGAELLLDTGAAQYVLAKGASPIREVRANGRTLATARGGRGLYVVDQKGRVASASADGESVTVEARGPVAACVRFEGFYRTAAGEPLARHITRVEAFAGRPFAHVTHTLVITAGTNKTWFKEIGWEFRVAAGAGPKATFGRSRKDWRDVAVRDLGENAGAFMMQDAHYRFAHGANHGCVAGLDARGSVRAREELEECGDWGALVGSRGGLLLNCRDAARQHPKEVLATRDRLTLKLFSDRAGEQLDFRMPALVRKWKLADWQRAYYRGSRRKAEGFVKKVLAYTSNAVGWTKTHELMIAPLAARTSGGEMARLSRCHSERFYAHVAPKQVLRSEVMGRPHPKDTKRFPDVERTLEAVWRYYDGMIGQFGDFGFMDYYAGPHCVHRGKYPALQRYTVSYTVRPDLWVAYVRSAERAKRRLTENVTRTYMDSYMNHWTRAEKPTKVKGLFTQSGGRGKYGLPLYWEPATSPAIASSTNLNNLIWMYHLTGYRRARDCVVEYGEGVKSIWRAALPKTTWRPIMLLRCLAQTYGLTHDPTVRAMAEATADFLYDPESELRLNKDKIPNSMGVTYKLTCDQQPLLDIYEILGGERYRQMALRVAWYRWNMDLTQVVGYNIKTPYTGAYLHKLTGRPDLADWLAVKLRLGAPAFYDAKTGEAGYHGRRPWETAFAFRLPFAMDVVARTGADRKPLSTWIGFHPAGAEARPVVRKGAKERVDLFAWNMGGLSVNGLTRKTFGGHRDIRLTRDAKAGDYAVTPGQFATAQVLSARGKARMVLYAPEYWEPFPRFAPGPPIHFRVPKGARRPRIFFEKASRLFDPKGAPFPGGGPVKGWVDLPESLPGLWRFHADESGLVRLRNAPPFFAFGGPEAYFEPDIPWRAEPIPPPAEPLPAQVLFVPGVSAAAADRALHLARGSCLVVRATKPGQGGLLPTTEGTVEFFFKPEWSSVELKRPRVSFVRIRTDQLPWKLDYIMGVRRFELWSEIPCDGEQKRMPLRARREYTLFERGEWVHVAWVWGLRHNTRGREGGLRVRDNVLVTRVFVNGKAGSQGQHLFWGGNRPRGKPSELTLLSCGGAAFDELRVSAGMRYWEDFEPPPRNAELRPDKRARLIFHFNDSLLGVAPDGSPSIGAAVE